MLMIVWRVSLPALIYPGDRITWKVLAEYSWSPTTTQSGSFLCTAASSTPIRVVIKEVRYIHELSLTLKHSIPISSPTAPGLTLGASSSESSRAWLPSCPNNSCQEQKISTYYSIYTQVLKRFDYLPPVASMQA